METSIAYLATDIGRLFRKRVDCAARPVGVTGAQLRVMLYLLRNPGANQASLAAFLEIEPITAGRMVDRMAGSGLVERRPDPADRRAWRLFVTAKGEGLVLELRPELNRLIDESLSGLKQPERDILADLLRLVRANLLEQTETPEKAHG